MSELSVYGVVATAHRQGVHLTVAGFRSMVSRGDAPEAAQRVGRQPFWDRQAIQDWATGHRGNRSTQPPRPSAFRLRAAHLLDGQPEGDVELAWAAVTQLPQIIDRIRAVTTDLETAHLHMMERSTKPARWSGLGEWLRWLNEVREIRAAGARTDEYWDDLRSAADLMQDARSDLEAAQTWLNMAGPWTEWARREVAARAEHATFDAMLAAYMADHREALTKRQVPVQEWIAGDQRRLAFVAGRSGADGGYPDDAWRDADPGHIHLGGADFSYDWPLSAIWPGRARLSWIASTGDLYLVPALPRDGGTVVPLDVLPHEPARQPTLNDVIEWLRPFEEMSGEFGSLGLLAEELRVRRQVDWWGVVR